MSDARILDRGYRKYEGARSGIGGAVRSVAWHTTRSILGLGRPARHKVFPGIVIFVAFVPAISFLALAVLVGDLLEGEIRPAYWEFFGFSFAASMLFAALVAPEAVVRDRRDGMYSLYLSTPLTRVSYLAAKVVSVMGSMAIVVLAPPLLMLFGYTVQSMGPDGPFDWFSVLGRMLVAGFALCAVLTAVSLGAASLTDRRAFASIAVILLLFGSSAASALLVDGAGLDEHLRLLDSVSTGLEVGPRLFGDRTSEMRTIATPYVIAACAAWTALGAGLVALRYRKLAAV